MPYGKIEIGALGFISCSQNGTFYHCGYGTMLDVYDRYKGIPHVNDFSEEARKSMEFGTYFEDSVAQFFMFKTGLKVRKMGNGLMAYWRKDMPYYICHPDRVGVGRDKKGRRFALEIKCVRPGSEGWGEEWTAEIPDNYYLQAQGYFACGVPCEVVYVACMRGNRVYIYEVEPDSDVIGDLLNKVRNAKESFDKGIIPEPENYGEALNQLLGKVDYTKEGIPAGDEGLSIWKEMLENHKTLKAAEAREEELKTRMVTFMGDAPAVITADEKGKIKTIAKLTKTERKTFDKEAFIKKYKSIYEAFLVKNTSYSVTYAWPRDKKEN